MLNGVLDRVEGLEGLRNLTYFRRFSFSSRDCDTSIVGQLPASLQVFDILVVRGLVEPDVLVRCSNLCKLKLGTIRVVELDLSSCSSLQSVTLCAVQKLQTLSLPLSARGAWSLKSLVVCWCADLADIPGLDELIGLERLELGDCPSLKELPDLQNLTKLQVLRLQNQRYLERKVVEVSGCCFPRQLREFYYPCSESNEAPNVSGFEQLQMLSLFLGKDFEEPVDLESLRDLPALRCFTLRDCKISSRLPDLSKSTNLEELSLLGCEMELHEEDIRMLASLPLLQPVQLSYDYDRVKLDLVRRKLLRSGLFGWKESDLGNPPIKIRGFEVDSRFQVENLGID